MLRTVRCSAHPALTADRAPAGGPCFDRRPDRYVPLFGAGPYDAAQERPDDVPFEEQLRGMERVIKAGKVRCAVCTCCWVCEFLFEEQLRGMGSRPAR